MHDPLDVTEDDLRRIQSSLAITLPESYRRRLAPYPVPAAAGNCDLAIWDDVDRLISLNLELRAGAPGGVKPWPVHFFATGHPDDGSPYALDLRQGDAVWWVDHSHLDNPATAKEAESFGPWADRYFATLRDELTRECIDPEGAPSQRAEADRKNAWAGTTGCLAMIALLAGIIALIRWIR